MSEEDVFNVFRQCVAKAADLKEIIDELTAALELKQAEWKTLIRDTIPDLMRELHIEETKVDGLKVTLRNDAHPSIAAPTAYKWMDDNGYGGLIKTNVTVQFNRDLREHAVQLRGELEDQGFEVLMKEDIHFQTLRSWAKEMVRDMKTVPEDVIALNPFVEAVIKEIK